MRLNFFHGKSLNSSFMHKIFGWPIFINQWSPQTFRQRETKTFGKIVITYYPKFFRYQKISERQGSPAKFLGTVRQKVFHGKSWNTLIMHKSFGCPKFFQIIGGFSTNFRHCETKTINISVILLLSKTICYQNVSETQNDSPTMFSATWDKKTSTEKRDTPLFIHKLFPY